MKIVTPAKIQNGVRKYANVQSRTTPGKTYIVCYIRTATMRRFTCQCIHQNAVQAGKRRNCEHIRQFRKEAGL